MAIASADVPEDLFRGIQFFICGEISDQVIDLLTKYGGKRQSYLSEMVSHVIVDDVENSKYQEDRERFDSEWVLYSVKLKRLLFTELFFPEVRLFSGVVACPSKEKCEKGIMFKDRLKSVNPRRVSDSVEKGSELEKLAHLPKFIEVPKPPSAPKPPTPPKPEPMKVAPSITQPHRQQQQQIQQAEQQQMKQAQNKMPVPGPQAQVGTRPPSPQPGPSGSFPAQPQQWPQFWGHNPAENVPPELCLLGCIFYIKEFQGTVKIEKKAIMEKVIEQYGGQVDASYSNRVTHVICANQKSDVYLLALRDKCRIVTALWLYDVLLKKKLSPPWQALHLPLLYSEENEKPCSNQTMSITGYDGNDRWRVAQMIKAVGAKYTPSMRRRTSALVFQRPEGIKYRVAKEWGIPVVNVQWLSDLILGHMDALHLPVHDKYLQVGQGDEFQMDVNKVLPFMAAWRTPLILSEEIWMKFLNTKKPLQLSALGQETIPNKKQRLEEDVNIVMNSEGPRILFTGFTKRITKKLHMMITQLGGNVVENPQFCTHLVARSFSRNMEFLVAINVCQFILGRQWIDESHQKGILQPESIYMLHDPVGEAEIKCSLAESLRRARAQRLFRGLTFFITSSVQPPVGDLQKIIESAGGTVTTLRLAPQKISSLVDDQGNPTYIVITCADDIHLCGDLLNSKIKLYTTEFVLTGVLRQEKNFELFQMMMQ